MGDLDIDDLPMLRFARACVDDCVLLAPFTTAKVLAEADALVAEVRRLRAENARLDAICWALNQHTPTVVDEEFGFRLFGRACEHPSLTGDRCDACGWTDAWEATDG